MLDITLNNFYQEKLLENSIKKKRTLYIECTHTATSGLNTGIQRVVREIISNLPNVIDLTQFEIQTITFKYDRFLKRDFRPVAPEKTRKSEMSLWYILKKAFLYFRRGIAFFLPEGRLKFFIKGPRYDKRTLVYLLATYIVEPVVKVVFHIKKALNFDDYRKTNEPKIDFKSDDILLLLDSSWYLKFWDEIERFKSCGGKIYNIVYDLIPITHPQFCDDYLVHVFKNYFYTSTKYVDKYICISNSVAKELRLFLHDHSKSVQIPEISYFHLGSNFAVKSYNEELVDSEIKRAFSKKIPMYLIVSTVEPRKNHEYLLKVFDELWAEGVDVGLCIVGRIGWKVDKLINQILTHPMLGKKLFMYNDASDVDVSFCYEYSVALLFPSIIEGFGLPIIEGLQRGLPVFASDTEIHREVGCESAQYFSLSNSQELKNLIKRQMEKPELFKIDSANVNQTSWNKSANWLWSEMSKY